jgi:Tim17/Tim22/Tim23/Pmp24 family
MAEDRATDCPSRIATGLGSGFIAGSLFGGIASNWGDVPVVLRNKPWPALVRTGSVMMQHGTTLGLVGLAYSTVDCIAESIRGKKDWVNGSLGGLAAGGMIGLRGKKIIKSPTENY